MLSSEYAIDNWALSVPIAADISAWPSPIEHPFWFKSQEDLDKEQTGTRTTWNLTIKNLKEGTPDIIYYKHAKV